MDSNVYKTLKDLTKEGVYKFLYGVWYDSGTYQRLGKSSLDDVLFLSFNRHFNEISILRKNYQEIAHIEYMSKSAYNTLILVPNLFFFRLNSLYFDKNH